jgi:hypothetical protein
VSLNAFPPLVLCYKFSKTGIGIREDVFKSIKYSTMAGYLLTPCF